MALFLICQLSIVFASKKQIEKIYSFFFIFFQEKKAKKKDDDDGDDYDVEDKPDNQKMKKKKETERKDDSDDYEDLLSKKKDEKKKKDTLNGKKLVKDDDYDENGEDKTDANEKEKQGKENESTKKPEIVITPKSKFIYGNGYGGFSGYGSYSGYSDRASANRRFGARDNSDLNVAKNKSKDVLSLSLSSIMNRLKEAEKSSFSVEKVQIDFTKAPTYNVRDNSKSTTVSSIIGDNNNGNDRVKTAIGGESMKKLFQKMHQALDDIARNHFIGQIPEKTSSSGINENNNETEQKTEDAIAGDAESDIITQEKVDEVGESKINAHRLRGKNLSDQLWTSKIVDMLVR